MVEYNLIYSIICLSSAILVFSLSLISFVHYKSSSSKPLGILMFCAGIYAFGYAFEIMKGDPNWTFFWLRIEYLGISFIAGSSLWLSLEFTGKGKHLKQPFYIFIFGISVFFLITVLTNNFHNLFYTNIEINEAGPFPTANLGKGIFYIAHSIWLFSCLIISLILYIHYYIKCSPFFKKQSLIMLIGSIGIVTNYSLYIFGFIPWDIDIGPIIITINGFVFAYAIFRVGLLDISPIAREKVFESMDECVIVTDLSDLIVDYNTYALKIFPELSNDWLGESLFQLSPEFRSLHTCNSSESKPIVINDNIGVQYYHIKKVSILGKRGKKVGYAWHMKQITEQYILMERLKEYAEKDELTGIWNRRKWLELATNEIERSIRYKRSISLMLIDIDYFKDVNDTMGHEAGDKTLVAISKIISTEIRNGDIFGRIGGEEFAIVFLEIDREKVKALSQRLLTGISNTKIEFEGNVFSVTISAGIAICEDCSALSLKELMRKADIALYKAKKRGRNRVVFA